MSRSKKNVGAIAHKTGVDFCVWAPFATGVAVTGSFNDWQALPMDSDDDGYWSVTVKGARPGQEYKFIVSNGEQVLYKNDPRALQLTTTDGNSVIADTDFDWENDAPRPYNQNESVLYELHVGTFNRPDPAMSGTFESAIEKLDYLADLGVTTIEVMPVGSMPMDRGWGYAIDYLFSVESMYGGRHGFMEFIKAAHERGMAVILDVVYNHIGPDENLDLWQFDGWSENGKGGIYFYNDWRATTPWGETRPDYGREEVRQFLLDNASMWLTDFHLDGLRVDSTIFIRNVKGNNDDPGNDIPEAWHLLQKVTDIARKINPRAVLIAEDVGANDYVTKPTNEGGAGFGAQWQVNLPYIVRDALSTINDSDRNIHAIADQLAKRFNDDAFKRVVYSDSHDSAANNGAKRLNEEISPGQPASVYARQRSLLAAGLTLTIPGMPMLLQGEEFLQGGNFNDWQALEWDKSEQFKGIVLAYKHLIGLRKNQHGNTAGLLGQSVNVLHLNDEAKVLAYHRWNQGGRGDDVVVILNFANKTLESYRLNFPRPGTWTVRFNSSWKGYSPDFKEVNVNEVQVDSDTGTLTLPPYSVLILSQDV
jgi:1,4-alpha-glucan branching enzyme